MKTKFEILRQDVDTIIVALTPPVDMDDFMTLFEQLMEEVDDPDVYEKAQFTIEEGQIIFTME